MRILIVMLLLAAPSQAQKFYPDDPLTKEPPPVNVENARRRKVNDLYDLLSHSLGQPGERHIKGELIRARSTNTLDEVPDSPWFTNRIGTRPMTVADLIALNADSAPPAPGVWTVIGGKTEGISPGFQIRDSKGEEFFLKFDPLANPGLTTAAEVIGSYFFQALGYNVPVNHLVSFDPQQLRIDKTARTRGQTGKLRPLSMMDIRDALAGVPRLKDGRIRGVASHRISGEDIGGFRFSGTRSDDPNDVVRHEHRRELRALHVFCAWLNHNDSRAINTLDSIVEENGRRFIRHYLIDFGSTLGSASVSPDTARDGNEYFYQFKPAFAQIVTLGAFVPRWARAKYLHSEAVGTILDWEQFDPEQWKPNYPNPAFRNRLPDDNFWAAKKVMAFSNEHIRAIVRMGQYSDPADEELLVRSLVGRRDRIGRTYFQHVLPLDNFHVAGNELRMEDLAVKFGLTAPRQYVAAWSRFDNQSQTQAALTAENSLRLPNEIAAAPVNSYFAATIRDSADPTGQRNVVVYLRMETSGPRVVGVERNWQSGPGTETKDTRAAVRNRAVTTKGK